jgi:predicted N-acetyltransferase YhbS
MARDTLPIAGAAEDRSLHLIARLDGATVGCVLFRPESATAGRLFQMAVAPSLQGQGLGARLVERLERELHARGYREVHLHARDSAIGFYERLGYAVHGDPFTEIGLPHHHMRKPLAAAGCP